MGTWDDEIEAAVVEAVYDTLEKALQEAGISACLSLELADWSLKAELRWETGQAPAWEPWEGEGELVVYLGTHGTRVEPHLRVRLEQGQLRFPNLRQVVQAIDRYELAYRAALAFMDASLAAQDAIREAATLLALPNIPARRLEEATWQALSTTTVSRSTRQA